MQNHVSEDAGLEALALAVERQLAVDTAHNLVKATVHVPHAKHTFEVHAVAGTSM
jgi:hypothetical protein